MLNTTELALRNSEDGKFYVLCFCHNLKINANRRIPIKGPSLVSHTVCLVLSDRHKHITHGHTQCSFVAALTKQHTGALLQSLFTSELTTPYWLPHSINTSYMLIDREKEEDGRG